MGDELPITACCLKCGYLLRGLPEAICPECGQSFDPADPRTYTITQQRRRLGIWMRRAAVLLALVGLLFALAPRNILKGRITFTWRQCGRKTVVQRWELQPPNWIRCRYPAYSWTTETPAVTSATQPSTRCTQHQLTVKVAVDFPSGSCTGSTTVVGGTVVVNGQTATPESADGILESMMSPSNTGITIGTAGP